MVCSYRLSWSALFADYDKMASKIFVGNGIPKRPNDLDYVKYYSNDQIKKNNNYKVIG
jgi:hypothetical protein